MDLLINDYSGQSLKNMFDKHISKENTLVRTDGWTGYGPRNQEWNIETVPSNKGKIYPEMHTIIMNLKSWLRGIHHKCSEKHMQAYLNEFFYRFNRRGFIKSIFHNLIEKMVRHVPLYHEAFTT